MWPNLLHLNPFVTVTWQQLKLIHQQQQQQQLCALYSLQSAVRQTKPPCHRRPTLLPTTSEAELSSDYQNLSAVHVSGP